MITVLAEATTTTTSSIDWDTVLSGLDLSGVTTGMVAVVGIGLGVLVAGLSLRKGISFLTGLIRKA